MSHNFAAIEPKTLKCDKNFLKKLKKQKIARRPFINNCGVFFYEKGGRGGGGGEGSFIASQITLLFENCQFALD